MMVGIPSIVKLGIKLSRLIYRVTNGKNKTFKIQNKTTFHNKISFDCHHFHFREEWGREGRREGGGGRKDMGESFSLVLESAGQDGTVEHHDGNRLERNPCDFFSVSLQVAMVTYQMMTLYGSFRIHVLIPFFFFL